MEGAARTHGGGMGPLRRLRERAVQALRFVACAMVAGKTRYRTLVRRRASRPELWEPTRDGSRLEASPRLALSRVPRLVRWTDVRSSTKPVQPRLIGTDCSLHCSGIK